MNLTTRQANRGHVLAWTASDERTILSQRETSGNPPAASGIMFLTIVAFLPPSYLLLGVIRAVLGKPGLSVSPLIAAFATGLIWTLTVYWERQLKSRDARWKEHNDGWVRYLQFLAAVTIVAPILLGLIWPLAVLPKVAPAVGFMLSAVPTIGLVTVVAVNRYRFLKSGEQS